MGPDQRRLRLELLRLRGEMQRAELARAVADLRGSARPSAHWAALAAQLAGTTGSGRRGWLRVAAAAWRLRPWLIPVAVGALQLARRHPLPALAAALAALATTYLLRRPRPQPPLR